MTTPTHFVAICAYGSKNEPDQPRSGSTIDQMKRKTSKESGRAKVVFLFDVDNTLLDNDRVTADLTKYLKREVGLKRARRYWAIFEQLRTRLGYADYLGALQSYRREYSYDLGLLAVSRFLINYPFANRLFPNSLAVIERVEQWGSAKSCLPMATSCSSRTKWTNPDFTKQLMDVC